MGVLLIGRVIATLISATVQVFLMGFAMYQLLGVRIPLRLEALPALLVTLLGVCGFGFIIAGAMLIFKQVESFSNLMNNASGISQRSLSPAERHANLDGEHCKNVAQHAGDYGYPRDSSWRGNPWRPPGEKAAWWS